MKKLLIAKAFVLAGLMLCAGTASYASQAVVSANDTQTARGVVLDAKGEPVIGASVLVKGTLNGTVTGQSGEFSISGIANGTVLEVSSIGYITKEVTFNGGRVNVVLDEDNIVLDDVVVVGYGVQKKVNLTGAVSVIDSKVFESRPVQNVAQALQGQIPGLDFSVGSYGGELDNAMTAAIRGTGTVGVGSNATPLVLIDGIEGDMNTLNPNDVESISVLKDASSAAVYGAKGAFGVILITTKSGNAGNAHVSFNSNVRFNSAINIPTMANSIDFANYYNWTAAHSGLGTQFSEGSIDHMRMWQEGELAFANFKYISTTDHRWSEHYYAWDNNDWGHIYYKDNVPSYSNSVALSGGNDKVNYRISGSWLDQNGLLAFGKDKLNRYTLDAKFSAQLNPKLRLKYFTKWTRDDYDRPSYMEEYKGQLYFNVMRTWPTYTLKDPNGHYTGGLDVIRLVDGGTAQTQSDYFTNQIALVWEPLKNWHINIEGSMRTWNWSKHEEILPVYYYDAYETRVATVWDSGTSNIKAGENRVKEQRYKEDYFTTNLYSDYSWKIGENHNFTIMGGFNAEQKKYNQIWARGDSLTDTTVPYLSQITAEEHVDGELMDWAVAGFFGRFNYNYKEKYLLELNARYDGSSRFIGDKRWALFPSVSAGWNIANENFWTNLKPYVSMLKLRASWGQLGNTNTTSWYPFYQTMPVSTATGEWLINGAKQNLASIPSIVSTAMTWETIESWNLALDWAAFNNRLQGSFDWFTRYTYDMVGPAPTLPAALGAAVPRVNNADMRSRGWELEVSWRDHIRDFYYGARLVLSDAMQKVLRYPNETMTLTDYYKGMTLGEIWGYETEGIAQSDQEIQDWFAAGNKPDWGSYWGAGDIMYRSIDGVDGVNDGANTLDNHGDKRIIGNRTPRYNFGITLDFAWKGIDAKIFFQGVGKRDAWLPSAWFFGAYGSLWNSVVYKEHLDYWRPEDTTDRLGPNTDAYFARPQFSRYDNYQCQTRYIQNAAYIRLKNIQLGYTLPRQWTRKVGIDALRFYVTGDNLWTHTKLFSTFDPETIASTNYGAYGTMYPIMKNYAFGVNINF